MAQSDRSIAAIITKFKAPDQEKPTIRPYTPINDEGKDSPASYSHDCLTCVKTQKDISISSSRSIPTVPCPRISTK